MTLLNGTDANANGSATADRPVFNPVGTSNVPSGINFVCVDRAGDTSVAGSAADCGGAANVAGYVATKAAAKYVKAGLGTNNNIIGRDTIEVWSDSVSEPVAVRYAWADNPVCNLYSAEGLPVTPFRTDDWPGVTAHND